MAWLDETIIDWIVEALSHSISTSNLKMLLSANTVGSVPKIEHTGPVNTLPDFVDQVPTSWASIWAVAT